VDREWTRDRRAELPRVVLVRRKRRKGGGQIFGERHDPRRPRQSRSALDTAEDVFLIQNGRAGASAPGKFARDTGPHRPVDYTVQTATRPRSRPGELRPNALPLRCPAIPPADRSAPFLAATEKPLPPRRRRH